ncbi:lipocalin-15 [Tachysurus fulvidraco]|uniref:lipocalin-15 n=1 Tax=Tachysurus fulvidraco TaxID=1234273 RepID=UPI000F4D2E97|nr:lipocalin-15 [Tachysurus fulvidraco]
MLLAVAVLCSVVLWTHSFNSTDIQPQADFDLEKFAGAWYRVGFAYDHPLVIKYKSKTLISRGYLIANENGGANLTMWTMNSQKTCDISFYVYEKTEVPGAFTYFSQRHKIEKDITVVESNYTDYGVVLKYKNMNKEYTQLALYGRKPELRPEVVEHFRSFALSIGFSEEAIITPAIVDPCPLPEPSNMTELLD